MTIASESTRVLSPAIVFALESTQCWDEALPLIHMNQRVTGAFDPAKFTPNREFYRMQESKGILRVFTMRDGDILVGYQTFFCSAHPRNPATLCALQDAFYVLPNSRGPDVIRFMYFADAALEAEGHKPIRHAAAKNLRFAKMLEQAGYSLLEQTFIKG